ncbi:MAG: hypothetical protein ABIP48_19480 [Planctomycetota bacterium]
MRPPGSILPACIIVVAIGLAAAPIPAFTGENPPDISDAQWIWDAGEAHPTNYFLMGLPAELKITITVVGNIEGRAMTLDGKPVSAAELIVVGGRHQVFIK